MTILPTGVDIRRISDPTGEGAGAIFHPRIRPAPAPRIDGCGRRFHFSPVGDPRISKISNFDGFDLVNPPKFLRASKFWLSPILSTTEVLYQNPMWSPSYSPTPFFSWFLNTSCPCDWIHLHFAQTRGWPETRRVRAWVWLFTHGCGRGRVWTGAAGVAAGGVLSNPPRTRPIAIPTNGPTSSGSCL
jgi:hypothetical protein